MKQWRERKNGKTHEKTQEKRRKINIVAKREGAFRSPHSLQGTNKHGGLGLRVDVEVFGRTNLWISGVDVNHILDTRTSASLDTCTSALRDRANKKLTRAQARCGLDIRQARSMGPEGMQEIELAEDHACHFLLASLVVAERGVVFQVFCWYGDLQLCVCPHEDGKTQIGAMHGFNCSWSEGHCQSTTSQGRNVSGGPGRVPPECHVVGPQYHFFWDHSLFFDPSAASRSSHQRRAKVARLEGALRIAHRFGWTRSSGSASSLGLSTGPLGLCHLGKSYSFGSECCCFAHFEEVSFPSVSCMRGSLNSRECTGSVGTNARFRVVA